MKLIFHLKSAIKSINFLPTATLFDIYLPTAASNLTRCKHLVFYSVSQNKNYKPIDMNIYVWHNSLSDAFIYLDNHLEDFK